MTALRIAEIFGPTIQGEGALIGAPTAGWIIDRTDSYTWAIVGCIAMCVVSVALLFGLPTTSDGRLERSETARG